jgi:hypothetical protein
LNFVGRLAKEGARYGLKGMVADPEEEDMDQLQEIQVIQDAYQVDIFGSAFVLARIRIPRIRMLIFYPSRFPDPGVKKAPDLGSRIRNTVYQ